MQQRKIIWLVGYFTIIVSAPCLSQGNSVGINTTTPNPNAVLHLISPNGNQGLLIPKLSASQRTAMRLNPSEKGLLVFDDTDGLFYYWSGSDWNKLLVNQELQSLSFTNGKLSLSKDLTAAEVDLSGYDTNVSDDFDGDYNSLKNIPQGLEDGDDINDADADPVNEIQNLELTDNILKISKNATATEINLKLYQQDILLAGNKVSISGGTGFDLTPAPPSGGQVLKWDNSISKWVAASDNDADPTNELQTVSAGDGIMVEQIGDDFKIKNTAPDQPVIINSGSNASITGTYPEFTISVPSLNDADADPANEDQTVSAGDGIMVEQTGDDFKVKNTAPDQPVIINSGSNASITGTYPEFTVSVPSLNDADADPANEIQDLGLTDNILKISKSATATEIDLKPYQQDISLAGNKVSISGGTGFDLTPAPPSGGQVLKWDNSISKWVAASDNDADTDDKNEIQTISLTGSTLTLSNAGGTVSINDADADAANEIQDLELINNILKISKRPATEIDLTPYKQNISLAGNTVSISGGTGFNLTPAPPATGQVLKWDNNKWIADTDADTDDKNEIQTISLTGSTLTLSNAGGTVSINDADADATNEIQDLELINNILKISKRPATEIDLTPYKQNISLAGNTVSISDGMGFDLTPDPPATGQVLKWDNNKWIADTDADTDDKNEIQTISLTGSTLTLSNAGGTVSINDADADVTNEIQDLELINNILKISKRPATEIDLTPYKQNISLAGNTVSISSGTGFNLTPAPPSGGQVLKWDNSISKWVAASDNDADPTNELQTVSAGDGIMVEQTGDNFEVKNTAPDKTVIINRGSNILVEGTYPEFTVSVPSLNDADADATNEIQDLELINNILKISNNTMATEIDLTPYKQDISLAGNKVSISGGTGFDLTPAPPSGGQVLKWDNSISKWVAASDNDADTDDKNEIQTISLTGSTLTLSNAGGTVSINDADADAANEIQTISLTGSTLSLSKNGGTVSINDADADAANEIQTISLTGSTLSLSKNGGTVSINDADADAANEIQTISLTGSTLSLSKSGGTVSINDADADATNEIQDLGLTGNILKISNNPSPTNIDLTPYKQTLALSGTALNISNGNAVDLAPLLLGVLPAQASNGGKFLTTNGSAASWEQLGLLAKKNMVSESELSSTVAGEGLIGGAGQPLAVKRFLPNNEPSKEYNAGTGFAIQSITIDNYGRITGVTKTDVVSGSSGGVIGDLVSDVRLKKDITPLSQPLQKVLQLNGYTFYYTSDTLSEHLKSGVIAQEVQKVFPHLAVEGENGYLTVDYAGLIPVLLEALKAEHKRVTDLEGQLSGLKSQMTLGDTRMQQMEAQLNLLVQTLNTPKTTTTGN